MSVSGYPPEDYFLKKFALDAYNRKYGKRLRPEDCNINSIRSTYNYKYGYQIETLREDDHVIIRLYLNMGVMDCVDIVRLENYQNQQYVGSLVDEVYVVLGQFNRYYYDNGIYKFRWIAGDDLDLPLMAFLNGDFVSWEDGELGVFVEDDRGTVTTN